MRSPTWVSRLLALCALLLLPPAARGADPSHLEKLRLLPPVLVEGEKGDSLPDRMRHYKVEGVSVAVFRDFKILWTEARGFADREARVPATTRTLFQAGSISKPVAAAGVLTQVQAGRLALDRDVNDYLKSWKLPENALSARQKVTLERILSHSAGLTVHGFPGYAAGEPVPTVPQVLDGAPPANTAAVRVDTEPGTKWRYSGGGYTIAQLLMTDTLAKSFPQIQSQLVLAPAGMTHSTYEQPLPPDRLALAAAGYRADGTAIPGKRHTYPEMAAAGLWTTSEDLARFAIAIGRSRQGARGGLLSREMAGRMTTIFSGEVGLGFFLETHGGQVYFGHNGADEGFQALLIAHREKGYGAAVMVNSDNGVALAEEIVRGIAREEGWEGYLPAPVETVSLSESELAPLEGRYRFNGDEALTLAPRGARLFATREAGEEFELIAATRDLFVRKDRSIRYEVERSGQGVSGGVVITGKDRASATRMEPGARLPSDDLTAGRIDDALAAYRRIFAEKPADPAVAEPRLNNFGYTLANHGSPAQAIAILKLNTELYPASSNTYDSLAEILLRSGDRSGALATYRKVLEVLATDEKTEAGLKNQLRGNAESKIKELSR